MFFNVVKMETPPVVIIKGLVGADDDTTEGCGDVKQDTPAPRLTARQTWPTDTLVYVYFFIVTATRNSLSYKVHKLGGSLK